ncbi:MAG TPA: ferric reductase-like transmembrane domain-containing protein [Streptosporangiaceae bacterium]|nr:ferric reductase-like transmembrane domain-containing protein [Streptosporangiaceae bacterium]
MSSQALWYLTRATGVVAMVLLTVTILLGVIGSARVASERWPRLVTAGLHRNLALTATALVGVHIITTVLDPFVSISVAAVFIPFTSSYRPIWLGLGALALDLLLVVLITSLLRDRLNQRAWQAIHFLVYACWPIALWHALGTGTDTRLRWILIVYAACVAAVIAAVWWRLTLASSRQLKMTCAAAVAVVTVLTVIFALAGPLQAGWAARAGTPPALLGLHVVQALGARS